jgi:1,4-dihydroxy-2-naphthoate octaprenyltransferase
MTAYLKLSRPLHLLLAALTYLLGSSIPVYLGKPFSTLAFWLGLAGVLFAQLTMSLLAEVFRPHNEPLVENETPKQKETLRNNLLYVSYGLLTVNAVLAFLLYLDHSLVLETSLFLLSSLVAIILYAVHPFRLIDRGFGELALAAHIAYIIPSIGFLLQAKVNHHLLIIIIIPLTALALAYFLILNFTSFIEDQKYQRATLLRSLTWERAVPFHHSLIVFAYIIFAAVPLFADVARLPHASICCAANFSSPSHFNGRQTELDFTDHNCTRSFWSHYLFHHFNFLA